MQTEGVYLLPPEKQYVAVEMKCNHGVLQGPALSCSHMVVNNITIKCWLGQKLWHNHPGMGAQEFRWESEGRLGVMLAEDSWSPILCKRKSVSDI